MPNNTRNRSSANNTNRASLATIIRVPYVKSLNNTEDFLYATIEVAIWSSCELGLGMTAANCATLRPLFRRLLPSLGFQSSGGRTSREDVSSNVQYLGTNADAKHNTTNAKKSANRSSSRNDELELGGMGPKGFGTATSAWHHDEASSSDKEDDQGSNHSQTMIINTKTSVYRSEETAAPGGGRYWKEDRKS
jgi:hypothetical protein